MGASVNTAVSEHADEFDASLDRALDLTAVLQRATREVSEDQKLTRFEVVAALIATVATVCAKMEEPDLSFALGVLRTADYVVLETRRTALPGSKPDAYYMTREMLKAAFRRARAPVPS